ncbi:MAG: zinc ribbon domain-containing protein [Chloroflexi bacterium]|nr:zinc ribbon domain-containing protein [Chloroflexota bacterium]
MPIYEYECGKCRFRFELKRHFGEDGSADCPQCHGEGRRLFTSVPVIFKCSGFYVIDHRKGDAPSSDEKKVANVEPAINLKKD